MDGTTAGRAEREDRRAESGFSLLEVMVGISILIGGLMGLGLAMITAYRLDRTSGERKVALAFCQSQIERIRGMTWQEVRMRPRPVNYTTADTVMPAGGFLPETAWGTVGGSNIYSAAVGLNPTCGTVGFRQSTDGDGDEDTFGVFYTRQLPGANGTWSDVYASTSTGFTIRISDSRLNSLTPRVGVNNRLAQITFTEPDATVGLVEGSGYWVTVRVFWQGASGGREEERVTTFIAR